MNLGSENSARTFYLSSSSSPSSSSSDIRVNTLSIVMHHLWTSFKSNHLRSKIQHPPIHHFYNTSNHLPTLKPFIYRQISIHHLQHNDIDDIIPVIYIIKKHLRTSFWIQNHIRISSVLFSWRRLVLFLCCHSQLSNQLKSAHRQSRRLIDQNHLFSILIKISQNTIDVCSSKDKSFWEKRNLSLVNIFVTPHLLNQKV